MKRHVERHQETWEETWGVMERIGHRHEETYMGDTRRDMEIHGERHGTVVNELRKNKIFK